MDFLFVSSLRNEPARFYLKLVFLFSEENLALPACGQKQAPAGGANGKPRQSAWFFRWLFLLNLIRDALYLTESSAERG